MCYFTRVLPCSLILILRRVIVGWNSAVNIDKTEVLARRASALVVRYHRSDGYCKSDLLLSSKASSDQPASEGTSVSSPLAGCYVVGTA